MALTYTYTLDESTIFGDKKVSFMTYLVTEYATGGFPLTARMAGMDHIIQVKAHPSVIGTWGNYTYNPATGMILGYVGATGAEIGAINISSAPIKVEVIGE